MTVHSAETSTQRYISVKFYARPRKMREKGRWIDRRTWPVCFWSHNRYITGLL